MPDVELQALTFALLDLILIWYYIFLHFFLECDCLICPVEC